MAEPDLRAKCFASAFSATRDLRKRMKTEMLRNVALSIEEAEILVELQLWSSEGWYPREVKLKWTSQRLLDWMPIQFLQEELVHGATLLSRRLTKLARLKLLETRRIKDFPDQDVTGPLSGWHKNAALARGKPQGLKLGEEILRDYRALAEYVLDAKELKHAGLTVTDLESYRRVNELISRQLRPKQTLGALADPE